MKNLLGITIGFIAGIATGWALTPQLPPSPIAQLSPVTLPPQTGGEIKPTDPPPNWDRILEPNLIYPSEKWEDCKKYAIKYERKLLAIYNEDNSYAPYSCILEKYNPK